MNPTSVVEGLRGPWAHLGVFLVAFAEHALFVGTVLALALLLLRSIGADLAKAATRSSGQ